MNQRAPELVKREFGLKELEFRALFCYLNIN